MSATLSVDGDALNFTAEMLGNAPARECVFCWATRQLVRLVTFSIYLRKTGPFSNLLKLSTTDLKAI